MKNLGNVVEGKDITTKEYVDESILVGDGLNKDGDEISVTTPVQAILSQEEYDALPEAKKNKGLYVIPGDSGDSSGDSSNEIYSTEEIKIGTWIDGKPLYRKCFVVTLPSQSMSWQNLVDISGLNIDIPVSYSGPIKQPNGDWQLLNVNQLDSSGAVKFGAYGGFYRKSYFRVWLIDTNYTGNGTLYLKLEYTKTTDQSTIISTSNNMDISSEQGGTP